MGWTKSAKISFYQKRRASAIKHFKKLGFSSKEAIKMAGERTSEQYRLRNKGYDEINKLQKEIEKRREQGKRTKRMEIKRDNLARKNFYRWDDFEKAIGYVTEAEGEDDRIRGESP